LLHKGKLSSENSAYDQVYTLEKVLKIKKDPVTQTEFLDDVMKVSSCKNSKEQCQLTCSGWTKSQASHSGRPWRTRSRPRRRRLRVASHHSLNLAPSLTISIKLATASTQYRLPSFTEAISRLLWPYCRTYGHSLHQRSSKVSHPTSPSTDLPVLKQSSFCDLYPPLKLYTSHAQLRVSTTRSRPPSIITFPQKPHWVQARA
jgi:hypothetical protein